MSNGEKVMVAGHFCLDITPRFHGGRKFIFQDIFSPGKLTNVEDAVLSTGGPVSNTGMALAKLGVDVVLNGKIGQDYFGNIIREKVGEKRAAAFKVIPNQSTSYTIVFAPPGVDRFYLHHPGTNDTFVADDIDYQQAKDCRLFHFGYPPLMKNMYENGGAELIEIYRRVKKLGVTTSLDMVMVDPSSPAGQADWETILEKSLPNVDIFLPSIDEIAFMVDRDLFQERKQQAQRQDPVQVYTPEDSAEIAGKLLSMGVSIAVIKFGVRGLYLRTVSREKLESIGKACPKDVDAWSDREIWAATFKAKRFGSALGAGDATIAGFLCGLIRGFSPEETLQIANTLGWQNVQEIDALSGIRDWASTLELLQDKNRPRNPTRLDSADWSYSEEYQVYYGPNDCCFSSSWRKR